MLSTTSILHAATHNLDLEKAAPCPDCVGRASAAPPTVIEVDGDVVDPALRSEVLSGQEAKSLVAFGA